MAHELTVSQNGKGGLVFQSGRVTSLASAKATFSTDNPSYHEVAIQIGRLQLPDGEAAVPPAAAADGHRGDGPVRQRVLRFSAGHGKSYSVTVGSPSTKSSPNEVAFAAPFQPLVDQGVLKLETGGVLRDGADAWLIGQVGPRRSSATWPRKCSATKASCRMRPSWPITRVVVGFFSAAPQSAFAVPTRSVQPNAMASAGGRKSITVRVPSLVCSRLRTRCSAGSSKGSMSSPASTISS